MPHLFQRYFFDDVSAIICHDSFTRSRYKRDFSVNQRFRALSITLQLVCMPAPMLLILRLSLARDAPPQLIALQMDAMHSGEILKHRQHSRPVTVLVSGSFARERVILLREDPFSLKGVKQFLCEHWYQPLKAVVFKYCNRPLPSQPLWLSAPVIAGIVAEKGIIHSNRGQKERSPELLQIQEMLLHKPFRYIRKEGVPVHATQVVVQ